MKEVESGICLSDQATSARKNDLRERFNPDLEVWKPESAAIGRLNDLATKILSYEKQLHIATYPSEKKLIEIRLTELRSQTLIGV